VSAQASPFDITGRVAIVTGASSGLGRHFALTLARAGAKVAIAARRAEALDETARQVEAFDGRALPIVLDVTDAASVRHCVAEAETELGPISILINNAGTAVEGMTLDQDESAWDSVIDTNLKGAWLMAKEVAAHMANIGHGGSIVNIASVLGQTGTAGVASYCASKAGLINLTRALAIEFAPHKVRVNALAPGYFATDLNRDFLSGPGGQSLKRRTPQQRFGEPGDLDGALMLLASDASRYMTGSVVTVDGGLSARI
jgi:NAD(P)-dependent dehydrogenase (short-subunit alcohol dehydrogenase family)